MLSKNLYRRQLTESQRGLVASKVATLKAGMNQHSREVPPPGGSSNGHARVSQRAAAKTMNVGVRTVQAATSTRANGGWWQVRLPT